MVYSVEPNVCETWTGSSTFTNAQEPDSQMHACRRSLATLRNEAIDTWYPEVNLKGQK